MADTAGRDPVTAARAEIDATRARMSLALDELEVALVRTRSDIEEALDVRRRIRRQPLRAAAIVAGTGLILGFLTGGRRSTRREVEKLERTADRWETRARRLLEIARDQQEEIEDLEAELDQQMVEHEELEEREELAGPVYEERTPPRHGVRAALGSIAGRFARADRARN